MSAEDLARGLRAIDDEDVRQKVAAGDLSAAGDLELTDEEAGLLRGAADDYPEVAGFMFDAFMQDGESRRRRRERSHSRSFSPAYGNAAAVRPGRGKDL